MKAMTRQHNTFSNSISFAPTCKWNKGLVYCNILRQGFRQQHERNVNGY